ELLVPFVGGEGEGLVSAPLPWSDEVPEESPSRSVGAGEAELCGRWDFVTPSSCPLPSGEGSWRSIGGVIEFWWGDGATFFSSIVREGTSTFFVTPSLVIPCDPPSSRPSNSAATTNTGTAA